MTKPLALSALLILSFTGCHDAAKQQRDNQALKAAVVSDLKKQGEEMQSRTASDDAQKDVTQDAQE